MCRSVSGLRTKNPISGGTLCRILCLCVCLAAEVDAQNSIRLREAGTNQDSAEVEVGQTITIEVFADLGNTRTSGLSVFVTLPAENFLVIDQLPVDGTQPFSAGNLLEGELRNVLHSPGELTGVPDDVRVLEYQLLLGLGGERSRTGRGVVGVFQLEAIKPVENAQIRVLDNPNLETRVVLTGGGERRFRQVPRGMEVNVVGLEDVPAVIRSTTWAAAKSAFGK